MTKEDLLEQGEPMNQEPSAERQPQESGEAAPAEGPEMVTVRGRKRHLVRKEISKCKAAAV